MKRVALVVAIVFVYPATAHALTIPVTTTLDTVASDGVCSLREAITAANTDTAANGCLAGFGADVVSIPAGTYVRLRSGSDNTNVNGDLDITSALTLDGAGAATTTIDADSIDRVLDVRPGATATVRDLTLRE